MNDVNDTDRILLSAQLSSIAVRIQLLKFGRYQLVLNYEVLVVIVKRSQLFSCLISKLHVVSVSLSYEMVTVNYFVFV
jgi:hypothetical protein